MSERGPISPEWDEIVGERGAELSGADCCDFERWSGGSKHPRERGAEILTAQLRSHALGCTHFCEILYIYIYTVGTESIQTPLNFSLFVILQPFAKII